MGCHDNIIMRDLSAYSYFNENRLHVGPSSHLLHHFVKSV